ncbi:MAG: MoxR family ATPase [Gammaproteobacteria bacterium]|nr:MoxR family ATPase [Gammaproteobacteria bacterium]MBQ0840232.1 MoxR family ATPase [Gammaproteobacteria bacterium]
MTKQSQQITEAIIERVESVLVGKQHAVRLALACLYAGGHLLIEDLPGMGKTTLAQALAAAIGLSYTRVQFTSDLLPADIIGVSVYDRNKAAFEFHPGPLFNQLVLADEINRTTPKTQSALLEAMGEGQVSVEGETRQLPKPFYVIATQNPLSQSGTFPLPESQLDRFLMRLRLGYPDPEAERQLLSGADPRLKLSQLSKGITPAQLQAIQAAVHRVKVSDSLVAYLQRLLQFTRSSADVDYGISPRGGMAVLKSARAWALMDGRDYVIPEDIQAVFAPVCAHRLPVSGGEHRAENFIQQTLNSVDII